MNPFPILLIGCGGMGRSQAAILAKLPEYRLVAVADVLAASAQATGEQLGCAWGTNVAALLAQHRPAVVAICTGNDTHAALTIQAAQAGVKAVYCEKPMAVHLDDAHAMVGACQKSGTRLVINHQRRTGADLRAMRNAITSGAIGQIRRVRMQCAGDVLSDGTHLVDGLRFLLGDVQVEWVLAQLYREDPTGKPKRERQSDRAGWRYGHPIEDGAFAQIQFAGGIRAEVVGGTCVEGYCAYQHYEVFGTTGRLWRWGDCQPCAASGKIGPPVWNPNIFISDGQPGTHRGVFDPNDWPYRPQIHAEGGEWRVLTPDGNPLENLIAGSYRKLAHCLESGTAHPMDGSVGLADMELVTAIYASAQRGARVTLDDLPGRFPLYAMCPDARSMA